MGERNYDFSNLRKCFNQNSCLIKRQVKKPLFSQDSSLARHKQHLKLFIWQRHLGHLSSVVSLMFIRTELMLCCGFNTACVKSQSV